MIKKLKILLLIYSIFGSKIKPVYLLHESLSEIHNEENKEQKEVDLEKNDLADFNTERCHIRSATLSDYKKIYSLITDVSVATYLYGVELNEEEINKTKTWASQITLNYMLVINNKISWNNHIWVIEEIDSNEFIGIFSIKYINPLIVGLSEEKICLEIGGCGLQNKWQQSLGEEVTSEFIKKIFKENSFDDVTSIVIRTDHTNEVAKQFALKLNFQFINDMKFENEISRLTQKPCTISVYVLDKFDYLASQI